ncbi:MAG TPA: hypothetical protein VMF59_06105 [Bacteroidota bacterium]|nr:hypothetical protein [Bacteroidota bacterium]
MRGDLFVVLAGVMGALAFWSTALAEIAGVLLLVTAAAGLTGDPLRRESSSGGLNVPRFALLLLIVYTGAVSVSIFASGAPLYAHAGLLWHPLLFPAALLVPIERRALGVAGLLFVSSGAAASAFALIMNALLPHTGAPLLLTGLTTFADLLVLAGTVACAFIVQSGLPPSSLLALAAPLVLIAAGLIWSAERAPVAALAAVGSVRFAGAGPRLLAAWVCVAGSCLLLSPAALTDKLGWVLHGNPIDRYVVWEEGMGQAGHVPLFGFGPGSFERVLPSEARGRFMNRAPSSWHNDLLETWLDSGPLAAAALGGLLLWGVACGLRGAFRRWREKSPDHGREAGFLFLSLAAFGLVGSVVTTSVLGLAFWLLLGLTLNRRTAVNLPAVPRSS